MRWAWLFLLLGLAFGVDLNQTKSDALNYANQANTLSTDAKNTAENILCIKGGADCSYQGQDYKNFSQEATARQEYLNQANDPNSALGRALSTIWSTSDVKSTLFYQEATKLYQCDRVSPNGKCERYVGESYYGECQTVMECVSQTIQQSYAEYMCYVDSQGQNTAGESRYLCYVYNQIEPAVKEKEYVCHVVNTESIRTCTKDLQVSFGQCMNVEDPEISITGGFGNPNGVCGNYKISALEVTKNEIIFYSQDSIRRSCWGWCKPRTKVGTITFQGVEFKTTGLWEYPYLPDDPRDDCPETPQIWIKNIYGAEKTLTIELYPSGWDYPNHITLTIELAKGTVWGGSTQWYDDFQSIIALIPNENKIDLYQYVNRPKVGELIFCPDGATYDASSGQCVGVKCSLTNQTYTSKSDCYANCYTESVNDCTVQ